MILIATLQGKNIYRFPETIEFKEKVVFTADADIDCDGSGGNPDNDRYYLPDTTIHYDGRPLNAYVVPFIVVPPIICRKTAGMVLGCAARFTYLKTGIRVDCVVGDIGPTFKVGEISPAAAKPVGINPNPVHGGEDNMDMCVYEIWPGIPARLGTMKFDLQSFGL